MATLENWKCLRCGCQTFSQGQIRATGGFLSAMFDVQNRRFTTLTCDQCSHTEFYKADASTLGKIADFFMGG